MSKLRLVLFFECTCSLAGNHHASCVSMAAIKSGQSKQKLGFIRCQCCRGRSTMGCQGSLMYSFPVLTISLAGSRAVIGAEPCLRLLLAQLQLLGFGEQCPAGVPESLLLPRPILTDVDWHPGGPGGVAAHIGAGLQVAGLVLLENRKGKLLSLM